MRGAKEREHLRVHDHAKGEDAGAVRTPDERGRYARFSLYSMCQDDPTSERDKAPRLLRAFVELRRAKAMTVTRSRLHAIRYHRALERYVTEQGLNYGALVAISGTVRDGDMDYTEAQFNGFPESQTNDAFDRAENRFLVVANKFQTGFDQPLLHTRCTWTRTAEA